MCPTILNFCLKGLTFECFICTKADLTLIACLFLCCNTSSAHSLESLRNVHHARNRKLPTQYRTVKGSAYISLPCGLCFQVNTVRNMKIKLPHGLFLCIEHTDERAVEIVSFHDGMILELMTAT